jgi:hypothetical protein
MRNNYFFSDCAFTSTTVNITEGTASAIIAETDQIDKVILNLSTSSGSKDYNYSNI